MLQAKKATVLRDGDTLEINIDPAYIPTILNTPKMFGLRTPIEIAEIPTSSININSGIQVKDIITKIENTPIFGYDELKKTLSNYKSSTVNAEVMRAGKTVAIQLQIDSSSNMQLAIGKTIDDIKLTEKEYSLFAAIPAGINKTFSTISKYLNELKLIFSPETKAYKSVGSFISIGKIFPTLWNWEIFWNITAFLSIMLAVMNLLPIPALDGGHIVFTLYEIITRKKPSDKVLEVAQAIGMIILLLLIFLAFGNDIYRLFN